MHRSPLRFPQRALAGLIALGLVNLAFSAAAQTQAPPAQPVGVTAAQTQAPLAQPLGAAAPTQGPGSMPPQDGRERAGGVASPASAPPATTQPAVAARVDPRLRELARLSAQLAQQRAANHRWQVPTIGLALGIATIVAGWMLIMESMSEVGSTCFDENHCGDYNDRQYYAGVTLMMIGPALILISTPMLIVRGTREARIQRTEAAIRRLGGQVSLAPTFGPRGEAGFSVYARF